MPLFKSLDPFQIINNPAPIVVGAPHHGSRPNVDADQGTGPIALALATELKARAVIVSDMRRIVDVNKNPLHLDATVRRHARRYQNEMFRARPQLVIEIHGHVSGQYEVEITTGFDLNPALPGDARFLEKLATLKRALSSALAAQIGHTPTIGIYPLDRDVRKTATNTFTFQKIRRARNLVGLEWYGLHIELSRDLRMSQQAQKAACVKALAGALAATIRTAFEPLPSAGATIPLHSEVANDTLTLLAPRVLKVALAPEKYVNDNIAVVCPTDLEALGALDGDVIILRNGNEEMLSTITSSRTVCAGYIALPVRIRRQISLGGRGQVTVGRPAPMVRRLPSVTMGTSATVATAVRESRGQYIWLGPDEIERSGLQVGAQVLAHSQPDSPPLNSITLQADPALPLYAAAVSAALMDRLALTLGEVINLKVCH